MAGLSRRALVGTGAGLALAGSAAAAPHLVKGVRISRTPSQPISDAHLLALCAEAMRLDLGADAADEAGRPDEFNDLLAQWFVVAKEIATTPARTLAGCQAKSRIVRHLMTPGAILPDDDEAKWDDAHVYGPILWGLVHDMAGIA